MEILENRFQNIRYSSSFDVYMREISDSVERVLYIKISVPGFNNQQEKRPYKDFIICYDALEIVTR